MRELLSRLKIQILVPLIGFFILVASSSAILLFSLQSRLVSIQKTSAIDSEVKNAVIDFGQMRSQAKISILLAILTQDPEYIKKFEDIEEERANSEKALARALHIYPSLERDILVIAEGRSQSRELREKMIAMAKLGQRDISLQAYKTYEALFEINSARLVDIVNRLEIKINSSRKETNALYGRLILFSLSLLFIGFLVIFFSLNHYQKSLLIPIRKLQEGLRKINLGSYPRVEVTPSLSAEIRSMLTDFNETSGDLETLTLDLRKANSTALAYAQSKSDFLSNMSHEIRTPLNSILGMTKVLSDFPHDKEVAKYLGVISSSGELLLNLVNDILDFSKLEAGQITIEKVPSDLPQIMERIRTGLMYTFAEKSIEFEFHVSSELPRYVVCDPLRLEQVLLNLLSNAQKFTEIGSVSIDTFLSRSDNQDVLEIAVKDTGIGMSEAQVQKLFSRFSQADTSTTRKYGGTGLGLVITKQLVELMSGNLTVESEEGVGTTFRVAIPVRIANENEIAEMQKPAPEEIFIAGPPRRLRILLADDIEENRFLVKLFLKKIDVEIIEASNGKEALSLYENSKFDLILMDMQMPEMDGYEATAEIRRIEKDRKIKAVPVIALSAFALREERDKSQSVGCDLHLTKPIDRDRLLSSIRDLT